MFVSLLALLLGVLAIAVILTAVSYGGGANGGGSAADGNVAVGVAVVEWLNRGGGGSEAVVVAATTMATPRPLRPPAASPAITGPAPSQCPPQHHCRQQP
jgi:hypothetical protein